MARASVERLGVLCSGRGTDLQSIIDAIDAGQLDAEIATVLTDKPGAMAQDRAAKAGIRSAGVTLVILAGFMRILTAHFVGAYPGRIMNIHPALLPSFPGAHAHRDALAHGVKVSGCTVHFVDEGMDSGPIILQAAVPVEDDDTEETLAARVLEQEHILYPRAIRLFTEGRLVVEGRRVRILKENE